MAINHPTQHKRSSVAGNIPAAGVLKPGELGINFADKSIYTEDTSGNVIELERDIIKAAVAPASPTEGMVWYDTTSGIFKSYDGTTGWSKITYSGIDVNSINLTISSNFISGTGMLASPYITDTVTVYAGSTAKVSTITVTGLNPGQFVPIMDNSMTGKFKFTNYIADNTGTLKTDVIFYDTAPTVADNTLLTANIEIGNTTRFINQGVSVYAQLPTPLNIPTNTKAVATKWQSPTDQLSTDDELLLSIDGINFSNGPITVNNGDLVYTKWKDDPGTGNEIDSADGTSFTDTIRTSPTSTRQIADITVDKTPTAFSWVDVIDAGVGLVSTSNAVTVSGINSYAYITGSTTGSNLQYSKNGGAWTPVPAAATATDYAELGDNIQIRHTNGPALSTAYNATVNIGLTSDVYTSTTASALPVVQAPSISTPLSGSVTSTILYTPVNNIFTPNFAITSSAYSTLNGAGGHASTDWEIYSDAGLTTLVASSMADTINLTAWSPSGLAGNTQYWVRVKHRSIDPLDSAWSAVSDFTTGANQFYYPLSNSATDPTVNGSGIRSAAGYTFAPNDGIYTTARVTNLIHSFRNNVTFNDPDIALWDVSSATTIQTMFNGATAFNQDISGWDVSSAINAANMFKDATAFNQDISGWDVSNITSAFNATDFSLNSGIDGNAAFNPSNVGLGNFDLL